MSQDKPGTTAGDFDPEVLRLFDKYVHGDLDRRAFLERAGKLAIGVSAVALLDALRPNFAYAQVAADDKRIQTAYVEFESPNGYGKGRGYMAIPAKAVGKLPTVLVIHENRGLNPHIEDITRRLALDNFIAFAPDALFPLGGYPGDEDQARTQFRYLDQTKSEQDFIAAARFLRAHPDSNGKLGAVGFCYGGRMANVLATRLPDLDAAVPFYGNAPDLDKVSNIQARLQLHFAETDERVNATWPAYETALKTAGVKYEAFTYPRTQHGFNNNTTPRFDEGAAKQAWQRTVAFLNSALRG